MSDSTSFKSSVAEVKLAYNIVDYIQSSGIKLKQNGATKWKGLCPFHNEKSPSFSVDEHFQNYRCFGCGASGDLLTFVEKTENLEFFDAIKKLAEDKGIDLKLETSEDAIDYKSLRACIKAAANFYLKEFKKLSEDHPARKQVKERGLSFGKVRYGYAPEGRQTLYKHLKEQGFSDEVITKTGVCLRFKDEGEPFDFWHGRLMFFITDITGRPVGFSGRKLYETDKRGKYVNSPDGPLFDKSSVLYNIDTAKKMIAETKNILVVEGQFDVSAYVEAGMLNVVASSGTAFTEKQAMICRRITGENGKIIFCFDGDSAGSKAAEKVFRNVPMIHSQAYVVSFPEGQDPCDYRLEHGDEALEEYTKKTAKPIVEFVLDLAKRDFDLDSSVGRSRYLEKAAQILKTVASISLRDAFVKKVALDSFTSVDIVREVVVKAEPLESGSYAAKTEEEVETRPTYVEEEIEVELSEVVKLIKDDTLYNISARIMALSLSDSRFSAPLRQLLPIIPDELNKLADEIGNISHDEDEPAKALIPEMFKNSELAAYLISTDLFPLSHMMDLDAMKNHFKYLRKNLKKEFVTRAEEGVRLKISRILEESNSVDSEFLMKAIQKEEEELEKLKQSFQ
jgi:DNA primase